MARGRPRIPVEVHRFKGTYRKDRHGDSREFSTEELPLIGDPPKHLTDRQARIWQELKLAAVPGVLRVSDSIYLEIVVRLLEKYRHDPECKIGHVKELTTLLNRMGFGAADRLKMGLGEAKEPASDNPYANLDK